MRVSDSLLKTVAYLAYRDEHEKYQYAGTVFFVGKEKMGSDYCERVFAVTALHVIEALVRRNIQDIYIRVNLKTGVADWVKTKFEDWHYVAGGINDVALLERGIPAEHDHQVLPFRLCKDTEMLKTDGIGIGDEAILVGLYSRQPGAGRNIPIVRVGNIACAEPQKIRTTQFGDILAILVEVRSIGGLSGSPVFAQYGFWRAKNGAITPIYGENLFLIGMVHGHHEIAVPAEGVSSESLNTADKLNTGICIVVPFGEILNVVRDYNAKVGGPSLDI